MSKYSLGSGFIHVSSVYLHVPTKLKQTGKIFHAEFRLHDSNFRMIQKMG